MSQGAMLLLMAAIILPQVAIGTRQPRVDIIYRSHDLLRLTIDNGAERKFNLMVRGTGGDECGKRITLSSNQNCLAICRIIRPRHARVKIYCDPKAVTSRSTLYNFYPKFVEFDWV